MTDSPPPFRTAETAGSTRDRAYALNDGLCEFDSFEYHDDSDAVQASYCPREESPSTAILSAVATVSDTDLLEMKPLQSVIDTDALNAVAAPESSTDDGRQVTFEFHGYEVTVRSSGYLTIRPHQSPGSGSTTTESE